MKRAHIKEMKDPLAGAHIAAEGRGYRKSGRQGGVSRPFAGVESGESSVAVLTDTMSLGLLEPGERAELLAIQDYPMKQCHAKRSRPEACTPASRMEGMGLRPGALIEMERNDGEGFLQIKMDEARFAVGRSLAMNIMVRRLK